MPWPGTAKERVEDARRYTDRAVADVANTLRAEMNNSVTAISNDLAAVKVEVSSIKGEASDGRRRIHERLDEIAKLCTEAIQTAGQARLNTAGADEVVAFFDSWKKAAKWARRASAVAALAAVPVLLTVVLTSVLR